jgi:hypothetical protein
MTERACVTCGAPIPDFVQPGATFCKPCLQQELSLNGITRSCSRCNVEVTVLPNTKAARVPSFAFLCKVCLRGAVA